MGTTARCPRASGGLGRRIPTGSFEVAAKSSSQARPSAVVTALQYLALERPDDIGIRQTSGELHSYREIAKQVQALAAALRELGVAAGDVVSVQLPNWIEAV